MAKLTIVFGVLLMALGAWAYQFAGHHPHSFIPVGFGAVLLICGVLANSDDAKKRMLFMHIAVTVGLLGFLGTVRGMVGVVQIAMGQTVSIKPDAAKVQAIMGSLCLIFVLLCVRSFIAARRARLAA